VVWRQCERSLTRLESISFLVFVKSCGPLDPIGKKIKVMRFAFFEHFICWLAANKEMSIRSFPYTRLVYLQLFENTERIDHLYEFVMGLKITLYIEVELRRAYILCSSIIYSLGNVLMFNGAFSTYSGW
jgi:hypothetical protein